MILTYTLTLTEIQFFHLRHFKSGSTSVTFRWELDQMSAEWLESHTQGGMAEVCLAAAPLRYLNYDILMTARKLGHNLDIHPAFTSGSILVNVDTHFLEVQQFKVLHSALRMAVHQSTFAIPFSMVKWI